MNLQKASIFLLTLIALGLFALALDFAQPVLMPLVIALLFSFVLGPAVEFLHKKKVPRPLAISGIIVLILGVFFLIGLFFYTSFQSFVRIFPWYLNRLQSLITELSSGLTERLELPTGLLENIDWSSMVRGYLVTISGTFMEFLRGLFIVTIFLIFLLLERPFLHQKLESAFEASTSSKIGQIIEHINRQIGRYLTIKLLVSAVTGVLIWLTLLIIGLDFPIVWGFVGFLLNFIPNIGSTVHFFLVSAMGLVQFYPSAGKIFALALAMFTIQSVLGNFIDPRLQGRRLDLSPFLVLFSLIVWGWLWGVVGMLLATPITVAVKIMCENVPALNSVGVLMGKGFGRSKG